MRNYSLLRFLKLSVYFFLMYSVLTGLWYSLTGKFKADAAATITELLVTAAVFSVLFSVTIMVWFRRDERRLPLKSITAKELENKLTQVGYSLVPAKDKSTRTYKPVPPKASALAGKIFVQQSANFWHLHGPARYIKNL